MREIIIVGRFCRTRGRRMGKCEKGGLLRGGRAWGCEGLRGRNKGKRQNETVQRYSPCRRLPVGFAEVKSSDFHRRERLRPRWEGLRGAIRFVLCPGKGSVFFRLPTFLLELHSPSRSKDTSSVSLTLDTFTPESRALWVLSPSGTLGVQAPLRGRLAKCDALRLFLAARIPFRPLTTNHCSLSATSLRAPLLSAKIGANRDHRPRGSRRSITNDRGILAPCTM